MLILISDAFDASLEGKLKAFGEVTTDKAKACDADVILVRAKTICDKAYIDGLKNCKLIIRGGVGIDNIDKNYYLSLNDSSDKLLITPWDLDLTFGNSWGKNEFNGEIFNPGSYNDTKILNRIIENIDEPTLELLKKRYQELRKYVYNIETIDKFLNQYKNELNKDIIKRDTDRWYFYDLNEKTEQISNWSKSRFYFLDQYFDKL